MPMLIVSSSLSCLSKMRITALQAFLALVLEAIATATSHSQQCSTITLQFDFGSYHAFHLNSSYHTVGAVQIPTGSVNVSNKVSFCEIYASISYAKDAHLVFALWLPDKKDYRHRFVAAGNGGYAGLIEYPRMMDQLNSGLGFAVAGGDAGHDAYAETNGATFGQPGLEIPFLQHKPRTEALIRNAISIFTPLATALTTKYYNKKPKFKYFNGCSAGGAQGLALARYHPDLYDGIYASAPGADHDNLILSFLWNYGAQANNVLPQEVLNFVTNSVLDLCDKQDGVDDRLLTNPLDCPFDIESLACNDDETTGNATLPITCLTEPQLSAFKTMYAGPKTSDTGKQIYPGYDVGSEVEWSFPILNGLSELYTVPMLQNLVYNTSWDSTTFNFTSSEVRNVETKAGSLLDVSDPNLRAFRKRGGKILGTHGWADRLLTPLWTLEYWQRVKARNANVDEFFRLFMVPGGGHCDIALGYPQAPATLHVMAPLVDWVERGEGPREMLASDPPDGSGRTRKLCSWPKTARYVGGDEDDWESFVCE